MNWVNKIVPNGQMYDGYVKLGSLAKYKLFFQAWLYDNITPGDRQLNRMQAKYLWMVQKHLDLMANHSHVRATDFAFCICEVLRVSLKHCKNISPKKHYAHFPVLATQMLHLVEPKRAMIGDMNFFCGEEDHIRDDEEGDILDPCLGMETRR